VTSKRLAPSFVVTVATSVGLQACDGVLWTEPGGPTRQPAEPEPVPPLDPCPVGAYGTCHREGQVCTTSVRDACGRPYSVTCRNGQWSTTSFCNPPRSSHTCPPDPPLPGDGCPQPMMSCSYVSPCGAYTLTCTFYPKWSGTVPECRAVGGSGGEAGGAGAAAEAGAPAGGASGAGGG
jgi:hypothetical protein